MIYCLVGIAIFYLQDKFLFHPVKLAADHMFTFKIPFREVNVPLNTTDTISLVKFLTTDSIPRGVVVYYHGNLENVERYASFVPAFTKKGYEVWMPDYAGYGKSTGERNEKKMYEQAWQIQKMAMSKYNADSIIIYGKSLGTGIAAYAASVSSCRLLVLETPYYSIPDLFSHYAFMYPVGLMANYKIPTYKFLEDVAVPVVIFHGTADRIIPYSCAARLKGFLKPGDHFFTIADGKHNNLPSTALYQTVLDSLLR